MENQEITHWLKYEEMREEEATRQQERINSAIQDTIQAYNTEPQTMVEMILNIDSDITAENMFGILCNDFIRMRDVNLSLMKNYTLNANYPEKIILNIKSTLIELLSSHYSESELKKLKETYLK